MGPGDLKTQVSERRPTTQQETTGGFGRTHRFAKKKNNGGIAQG